MKTTNKLKIINTQFLNLGLELFTFIFAAFLLTQGFWIKFSNNLILVSLWLIILFSCNQLKGERQTYKLLLISGWILTALIIIENFKYHNYYMDCLIIVIDILATLKTKHNQQLNQLSYQIGFWIFGLFQIVYFLIGFVTLAIFFKIVIVFITKHLFQLFLNKRRLNIYFCLVLCGIIALFLLNKHYPYLILQILLPLIPRSQKKERNQNLLISLYQIISFWII